MPNRALIWPSLWLKVFKARVVLLMVLTALTGILLAPKHDFDSLQSLMTLFGIATIGCASGACNHLFETQTDQQMQRTRHRPLASGMLSQKHVILSIIIMTGLGTFSLLVYTNFLTYALTLGTMFGYSIVYTLLLKPRTPQNIVIGGFFGACPPLLGWTAITGSIDAAPLLLVLIVFSWTPPHFWALALARKDDYDQAGLPMFPNVYGDKMTRYHMLLYTIQLIAVSQLPYFINLGDLVYLFGANLLNLYFGYFVVRLWLSPDDTDPMEVFYASIYYLFALFLILIVEHTCSLPSIA